MTAPAGVMTNRWGLQPFATGSPDCPEFRWTAAPEGLVTRRQMRARGLCPGGAQPVARISCRRGRRWANLWDPAECRRKRVPTLAQRRAVAKALAARRWCPHCQQDVGYCIRKTLGHCEACEERGRLTAVA